MGWQGLGCYFFFSEIIKTQSQDISSPNESVVTFNQSPDVYFIIFDNMANFKTLENYYNYDTSDINSELLENNYYSLCAHLHRREINRKKLVCFLSV